MLNFNQMNNVFENKLEVNHETNEKMEEKK